MNAYLNMTGWCWLLIAVKVPVSSIRWLIVGASLALTASSTNAQVTELWRTGLTNSSLATGAPEYRLVNAVVDQNGGTIVGGEFGIFSLPGVVGFIAKFDAQGHKLWEFRTEPFAIGGGFDALDIDGLGNIYATYRVNSGVDTQSLWLIKLAPDGKVMWIKMVAERIDGKNSFLDVNDAEEAVVTGVLLRQLAPGQVISEQWIAKFDWLGNEVWRSVLPGYSYGMTLIPRSQLLTLTPEGSIIVVGGLAPQTILDEFVAAQGFAARYDSEGRLEWWTDQVPNNITNYGYLNVMVNRYGMVGATGTDVALFTKHGRLLYFEPDSSRILAETSRGNLMVDYLGLPAEWDVTKRKLKWRFANQVAGPWELQIVRPETCVVLASTAQRFDGLTFIAIDSEGEEKWRQEFSNYQLNSHHSNSVRFFRLAKDGTFRVVGTFSGRWPKGISVGAFALPDLH